MSVNASPRILMNGTEQSETEEALSDRNRLLTIHYTLRNMCHISRFWCDEYQVWNLRWTGKSRQYHCDSSLLRRHLIFLQIMWLPGSKTSGIVLSMLDAVIPRDSQEFPEIPSWELLEGAHIFKNHDFFIIFQWTKTQVGKTGSEILEQSKLL